MPLSESFFGQTFGITEHDLESYLAEALSAGGDYADLYFEYLATSQLSIDESIVKSAVQAVRRPFADDRRLQADLWVPIVRCEIRTGTLNPLRSSWIRV